LGLDSIVSYIFQSMESPKISEILRDRSKLTIFI
jgi:hypothetical protein